jgi:membrane protein implicated in regulation of membrane protease activity
MASRNYKIDLRLLSIILNAATTVMLIGGLLIGIQWQVLMFVGILGYSAWAAVNLLARRRDKREAALKAERKKKKNKVRAEAAKRNGGN